METKMVKFKCDICDRWFEEKDLVDREVLRFCFNCVEKNKKKIALYHSRMKSK